MQHGHGDNPAGSFSDSDIDHDFSLSHIVAQTAKIARQPDDVAYDLPESEAEAEENVPPLTSSQQQETPNEKLNQFDVARAKFSQLLESDDDDDSDIEVLKVVNDKHSNNVGGDNDDDDDKTAEMSEDDASSSPASSQKLVQRLRLSGGASLKTTGLDGFSSDEEKVEQEEDSPSPKQQQQQQKSNYSTSTAAAEQPGVYKGWRLKQTKEGHLIPNNTQPLVKLDDGTFKKPLGRAPKGGFQWDKYKGIWAVKNSPDEGDGNKELPKPDSTKSSTCRNDGAKGASAAVGTSKRRAAAGAGTKSDPIRCEQKIKYETVAFKDSLLKEGSAVFAPFPDAKSGDFYWGVVERKWIGLGSRPMYKIKFADGDELDGIASRYFHRMEEAIKLLSKKNRQLVIPKAPHAYIRKWNKERDGPPPLDAFEEEPDNSSSSRNDDAPDESETASAPLPAEKEQEAAKATAATTAATVTSKKQPSADEKNTRAGLTLDELYDKKCGSCSQCQERSDCGSCIVCIQNRDTVTPSHPICVQKMCAVLPPQDKAQQCKHIPSEWYYYFEESDKNRDHAGLVLTKRNGTKKWRSFETAKKKGGKQFDGYDAVDFYRYVGLAVSATAHSSAAASSTAASLNNAARNPAPHEEANQPWSLKKINQRRCGTCESCNRRPCGACDTCVHRKPGVGCLRMMCLKIDDQYKMQKSDFLPNGWTFYFSSSDSMKSKVVVNLDGLTIFSPTGRKYYSIEDAIRQHPSSFALFPDAPEKLYKYLGFNLPPDEIARMECCTRRSSAQAAGNDDLDQPPRKRQKQDDDGTPSVIEIDSSESEMESTLTAILRDDSDRTRAVRDNLPALYRNRCRTCEMCTRETCTSCSSCTSNRGRTARYPLACLRRICTKWSQEEKKQYAKGFPFGWTFYFASQEETSEVEHEDLRGLTILPPMNDVHFSSAEEALRHCGYDASEVQSRSNQFYTQIGAKLLVPVSQHPLIGGLFWKEWIRVDGSLACLTGRVTKVVKDMMDGGEEKFTVVYEDQTRGPINKSSRGKLHVPTSWDFDSDEAWDGCLNTSQYGSDPPSKRLASKAPFHTKWIVPRTYRREMVPAEEPVIPGFGQLPCVEITHRGYLLRFTVKKSTIENAGFGVFLSIRPLIKSVQIPEEFILPAGELLDFGVYAPYRTEDCRSDHEFMIKSIIHSYKNENYAFPSRDADSYLDITDNMTGELHLVARKHVPSFLNEINDPNHDTPSVHAKIDPEGSLHYLLGHTHVADGDFCFVADGQEEEIFIDYGESYELVRLREGYPRKTLTQIETRRLLQNDERGYVKELETFTANEVDHFIKTFRPMFSCGRQPSKSVLLRAIAVCILMRRRATAIYEQFHDLGDDESICDNGVRQLDLDLLVKNCKQMIALACDTWLDWHGTFSELQQDALQSDLFRNAFSEIYPQTPMETASPDEFRDLIYPEDTADV